MYPVKRIPSLAKSAYEGSSCVTTSSCTSSSVYEPNLLGSAVHWSGTIVATESQYSTALLNQADSGKRMYG